MIIFDKLVASVSQETPPWDWYPLTSHGVRVWWRNTMHTAFIDKSDDLVCALAVCRLILLQELLPHASLQKRTSSKCAAPSLMAAVVAPA